MLHVAPHVTHSEAAVLLLHAARQPVLGHTAGKLFSDPAGRIQHDPSAGIAKINGSAAIRRPHGHKPLASGQYGTPHGCVVEHVSHTEHVMAAQNVV